MIKGAFSRLRQGLQKTREGFLGRLQSIFGGKVRLDQDTLDRIEELLISADMGVKSAVQITRSIEKRLQQQGGEATMDTVLEIIQGDVRQILTSAKPKLRPLSWDLEQEAEERRDRRKRRKERPAAGSPAGAAPLPDAAAAGPGAFGPRVIFVVGVNGTGKTTSIAKLGRLLMTEGQKVMLVAGDTFRAAAVEQLKIWADRIGADCVSQGRGADPGAVVFDALNAAESRGCDVVIVDTAGRLHTKTNLMEELGKVARVIRKRTGRDPETLLVVDANTGQNGLSQAKVFAETIPIDGLILAKLDGTAKGGIVVAIAESLGLPVLYVGVGETADDLAVFDADQFSEALFAGRGAVAGAAASEEGP